MNLATEQRKPMIIPTLAASGKFGGFKPESERAVREAKVERSPALDAILEVWGRCSNNSISLRTASIQASASLDISAKDIEAFTILCVQFQEEEGFLDKGGIFISELINISKDDRFTIYTSHLSVPIDHIGYGNTKHILVQGNTGACAGRFMTCGSITIQGDTDFEVGCSMEGGIIIVTGNASFDVGKDMKGGEIHIEGDYERLANNIKGGRIFHKGQQIWPEGGGRK